MSIQRHGVESAVIQCCCNILPIPIHIPYSVIALDWALKFARTSAKLSATFTEWTTLWFSLNSLDDLAHFKQGLPTGGWTSFLFFSKDGQILGLFPTLNTLEQNDPVYPNAICILLMYMRIYSIYSTPPPPPPVIYY